MSGHEEEANITQRKLGYLQAQERLIEKTEMPEETGGWKTIPHPGLPLVKAFMRTLQGPALGGHFPLLWAEPWQGVW